MIKANIDGFFTSANSRSEIGGIFQDDQSTLLLHFRKSIEAKSIIHAEIMAIREVFLVAIAFR